jgi:Helix-turn-helix domain
MSPRFVKVREIADRFRVSSDAVYLWIRQGKIPSECVVRIAATVRVDEERFERLLRAGALYQARGRKPCQQSSGLGSGSAIAADNFTTVRSGPRIEHDWTDDTGNVLSEHPFSPEMTTKCK